MCSTATFLKAIKYLCKVRWFLHIDLDRNCSKPSIAQIIENNFTTERLSFIIVYFNFQRVHEKFYVYLMFVTLDSMFWHLFSLTFYQICHAIFVIHIYANRHMLLFSCVWFLFQKPPTTKKKQLNLNINGQQSISNLERSTRNEAYSVMLTGFY